MSICRITQEDVYNPWDEEKSTWELMREKDERECSKADDYCNNCDKEDE